MSDYKNFLIEPPRTRADHVRAYRQFDMGGKLGYFIEAGQTTITVVWFESIECVGGEYPDKIVKLSEAPLSVLAMSTLYMLTFETVDAYEKRQRSYIEQDASEPSDQGKQPLIVQLKMTRGGPVIQSWKDGDGWECVIATALGQTSVKMTRDDWDKLGYADFVQIGNGTTVKHQGPPARNMATIAF